MSTSNNLLVELFVEELPPKALKKLGEAFANALADSLKAQGLADGNALVASFASPRRLAVHVSHVAARAPDRAQQTKLMPVAVALDAAGQPTPALLKKLAALGLDAGAVPHLERRPDGKAEALFLDSMLPGASLADGLQKALDEAIARLPIPKVMQYQLESGDGPDFQPGWTSVHFVRPAHGLVALHGADVVPVQALGLKSGRTTQGHRFEAAQPVVTLRDADSYAQQLQDEGAVIASFEARRAEIVRQLSEAAGREGLKAIDDDALLDEVTALVERPKVLVCRFEDDFLAVPQECLILTMKANQKYFPLLDAAQRLTNRFLVVSNIRPDDPSRVIEGNERVVRPRLADARFFFDQDRRRTLESRVPRLGKVVYHGKLGTQGERVERVRAIARHVGAQLGGAVLAGQADRAALLAKADLLTDMVGEFPELQGIMGGYYARHDGETEAVAHAVEDHYKPRFAGDALPRGEAGIVVALADKLETLAGLFGIGMVPTGDKDPFALRRAALGVLRILIEAPLPLELPRLIDTAAAGFKPGLLGAEGFAAQLQDFMFERLKNLLRETGRDGAVIDAVLALKPARIDLVPAKLAAVEAFRALPEAEALAAANKRIVNILRKAESTPGEPDVALLQEDAEKALFHQVVEVAPLVRSHVANEDYTDALCALAGLRAAVDQFFEDVMVMAEEPLTRANRIALLAQLAGLMNQVADLSRLSA